MIEEKPVTEFICKIREKTPNTHEYDDSGYNRTYIAKTPDDVAAWVEEQAGCGADGRFFDIIIEEVEVVQ